MREYCKTTLIIASMRLTRPRSKSNCPATSGVMLSSKSSSIQRDKFVVPHSGALRSCEVTYAN